MTRSKLSGRTIQLAGPRRASNRPSIEALEARALMSTGGSPYLGYGNAGQAQIVFGTGTPEVTTGVNAQATEPDGKIVVVGLLSIHGSSTSNITPTVSVSVARLNADGSIDSTFGTGGVVNLFTDTTDSPASAGSVAVQPDGKILLGVNQAGVGEIVRLDADGSIDTTFGNQGTASLPASGASGSSLTVSGVAVGPNGQIVASETGAALGPFDLVGFNADGSIDTAFGTSGVVATRFATTDIDGYVNIPLASSGLLIQPDGKVDFTGTVLTTTSNSGGLGVLQLDANGTPDASFGTSGYAQFSNTFNGLIDAEEIPSSIALQADGKVVVGGNAEIGELTGVGQFIVARLDTNGLPDSSFGVGGTGIAPVGVGSGTSGDTGQVGTVLVAPDGKILLGGILDDGPVVARLTTAGDADKTFGQGGIASIIVPSVLQGEAGQVVGLAIRPDSVILATTSSANVFALQSAGTSDGYNAPDDFNNDGLSDPAIYLPNQGVFAYRPSGGGSDVIVPFGIAGAGQTIPAPGDYDTSGQSELGVYLPALGEFAYRPAGGGADVLIPFGIAGTGQTIPALGDYDGTGRDDISAYLPSLGLYAIRPNNSGTDEIIPFGIAGAGQSIPVPGDYEGTGKDDIAVYLPAIGAYAIRPSTGGADEIIPFGIAGMGQSIPMPGDYDGSGKTELAVYLPALGDFIYRPANGGPDVIVPFGLAGAGQTLPAVGDYTGSGHDELGVYLPSLGLFAYRPGLPAAPTGSDVIEPFGIAGAGQTVPFSGVPASNTLSTTVSAASVEIPLTADDLTATGIRKPKTGLMGS